MLRCLEVTGGGFTVNFGEMAMKRIIYYDWFEKVRNNGKVVGVKISELAAEEFPYDIEIIAQNLSVPWAIAIRDESTIYVTERTGSIRIIEDGVLLPQPLITLEAPFTQTGEGGLLGIALDPNFMENHYLYAMHSYREGGRNYNRVIRLIVQNHDAEIDSVIIDRIPGGMSHNGGRIKVGPDNKLYISTGDSGNMNLSQDSNSLAGKILRIELDGSIPEDNPFPGSPVYSLGFRNPQGLTWGPQNMYATEHGASAHDEINRILPGGNYGWPIVQGEQDTETSALIPPLVSSGDNTWAPSGISYINQGPWEGKLAVATLRGMQLLLISLDDTGTAVTRVESWLPNEFGRIREVVQAEDGSIYMTTSNRDGRGNILAGDDKVIRLIPKIK